VLQPAIVDVNAAVRELEKMLRRLIRENIELVVELSPDLQTVIVDASQLQQVIMNLVVNARDAIPHSGRIVIRSQNVVLDANTAHAGPDQVRAGRYVAIAVSDNGVGMDRSIQQHIFEPFFSTKAKEKGTGLGLSTVYGIVKQSGGYLDVESEPGRGTTFTVFLPVASAGAIDDQPYGVEAQASTGAGGAETVLLAEDELPLRRLVSRILRQAGYTVLETSDPADALRVAGESPDTIHALITDMVMPDMGGMELARRTAELRPDIRTLFMSGYAAEIELVQNSLRAGTAFLEKPFTSDQLLQRLRETLDAVMSPEDSPRG
jgi:two-component system cell cycle sensor histidine kinase/response regulator CckA